MLWQRKDGKYHQLTLLLNGGPSMGVCFLPIVSWASHAALFLPILGTLSQQALKKNLFTFPELLAKFWPSFCRHVKKYLHWTMITTNASFNPDHATQPAEKPGEKRTFHFLIPSYKGPIYEGDLAHHFAS
jgi:hypothetical protein